MTNKKFSLLETKVNEVKFEILEHGLLCAGEEWNFSQVVSPFNRLYFILDGEGCIRKEGQRLRLQKGSAYLIPAGTCYDYRALGHLEKLYIHFQIQVIPGLDLFGRCERALESEELGAEAGQLLKLLEGNGTADVLKVKAQLLGVIGAFLQLRGEGFGMDYSGFEKQQRVIGYVEQYLTASLTVEQAAKDLGESYFSLSRNFKQDTGMGLKEYMELLLLDRARRLLATTDLRIGEVAEELGFGDAFYFTKFFGRYEGMPPREYRRRKRC